MCFYVYGAKICVCGGGCWLDLLHVSAVVAVEAGIARAQASLVVAGATVRAVYLTQIALLALFVAAR